MGIKGNKQKGKNTIMKEKKMQVASPGFEPAPQLPPVKKVRPQTTGSCGHCEVLIILKYFSLPFTV